MKIKKRQIHRILLPKDYFEDDKEYWIEAGDWTNYQRNMWSFLFVKEGLTQKDIENQNFEIDIDKVAKKDFYFLAISILDTNLNNNWKNLSLDEKVDYLIWIDTQNNDIINFLLEEVKKVVNIDF